MRRKRATLIELLLCELLRQSALYKFLAGLMGEHLWLSIFFPFNLGKTNSFV
jgi:hypothetical protein